MSRTAAIGVVVPVILGAIFIAGFFHSGGAESLPPALRAVHRSPPTMPRVVAQMEQSIAADMAPFVKASPSEREKTAHLGSFMALTGGPGYRRAAQMSLKVEDCAQAEEGLETKLEEMKGEILEMVMEGTEGSRTCILSVLVPSDHFREVISHLRGLGKVQSERITASRLKPGRQPAPGANGHDVRELSHVHLRMADEKVAQSVLESRSVLSSSFDKSASHFMKGAAVMIEGIGYVLPFFLALVVMAVPFVVVSRIRRSRSIRFTE